MDRQPFRLVRALSRQLERALSQLLGLPGERLNLPQIDATFTLAISDQVDHGAVLALLARKLSRDTIATPLSPATSGQEAGGNSRESRGGAPVLDLRAARSFLRAVQRFPPAYAREVADLEAQGVRVLQHTLNPAELSSSEVSQLWTVAAQVSQWREVATLDSSFPLVDTLPLQGDEEFTEVLSAICSCTFESAAAAATAEKQQKPVRHRDRLLRDLLGENLAWERSLACLDAASKAPRDKQAFTLPLRVSNVVMLGAILNGGGGQARETALTEDRWHALVSHHQGGPSSLSGLTLHGWLQRAAALAHPATPPYVRASCQQGMVADLWRIYTERGDAEGTLLFQRLGLPALLKQERLLATLADGGSSNVVGGGAAGLDSLVVRALHGDMMQRYLGPCVEGERDEGVAAAGTSETATALPLPLQRPDTIVNLLLSFGFSSSGPATEREEAHAATLLRLLLASFHEAVPRVRKTILKLHDPEHRLDDLVRCWPLMDTVCLLVALERLCYSPNGRSHLRHDAAASLTAFAKNGEGRVAVLEEILTLVRQLELLSPELLSVHGTPRAVATLLLQAPNMTRELSAFDTCLRLLDSHVSDGFTRQQLSSLLQQKDALGLSPALVDGMAAAMKTLPIRV